MQINERIKQIRQSKNLSQLQVSEKLGIAQPNYGLWESGKTDITIGKLEKLAEIFGVLVGELLGLEVQAVPNGEAKEVGELKQEIEKLQQKLIISELQKEQEKQKADGLQRRVTDLKIFFENVLQSIPTIFVMNEERKEMFESYLNLLNMVDNKENEFLKNYNFLLQSITALVYKVYQGNPPIDYREALKNLQIKNE